MTDDIKQHLAEAAVNIVTGARRGSYGKPENNFGRIALLWQAWFRACGLKIIDTNLELIAGEGDAEYVLSASDVSPMMRLMKEARLCETPNHYDSHLDIIGYTMTGAEVNGVVQPKPPEQLEVARISEIVGAALDKQARKFDVTAGRYEARINQLQLSLSQHSIPVPPPASSDQETASSTHGPEVLTSTGE